MNAYKIAIFAGFLWMLPLSVRAQALQVNDTYTAQQLVQNVLIDSPCANVSNIGVSGDPFSGSSNSFGFFSNTNPSFPFSSGVVLSTARAIRSGGPNTNLIDEGLNAWLGDADLEQALGIQGTYNATILEFDFTPLTSEIRFDYLFASEEYHDDAQCIYSDGFAFLLKPAGSTAAYQNLAVLPGTNTPVLVTTVHPAVPGSCPAANEQYFGQYNGSTSAINFNGQTAVLTASATVVPGTTYHIKLVIADQGNVRYDSAIFLAGGSFAIGTDIGSDRTVAGNNPLCPGDTQLLDAFEPAGSAYQWFQNGVPIAGATSPQYIVSSPGTYSVDVSLGGGPCIAADEVLMEYVSSPTAVSPVTLQQCDDNGDNLVTFNLLSAIPAMGVSNVDIRFYPTLAAAQSDVQQINDVSNYTAVVPASVTARIANAYGCFTYATVQLQTPSGLIAAPAPVVVCDNNADGTTVFSLNGDIIPAVTPLLPPGANATFHATLSDAAAGINALLNFFTNTTPFNQSLFVRVSNGVDCLGLVTLPLQVNVFQGAIAQDETRFICPAEAQILTAEFGNTYLWNTGATTRSITVGTAGDYSVIISDTNGCTQEQNFSVLYSEPATINSIEVGDFQGGNNTVTINASGAGNYQYTLANQTQTDPTFENVPPGIYEAFVADSNGCTTIGPLEVVVMDYPRFFTPNADNINDRWLIKNLQRFPAAIVTIFDRFGKILHRGAATDEGWDGTFNNSVLPASDYWFVIDFANGKEIRGHFSLKR